MANQRMFIKCNACGEEKFLAKRMMSSFYTVADDGVDWALSWDKWYEKHEWGFCDPQGRQHPLDIFKLVYEHVDENGDPDGA